MRAAAIMNEAEALGIELVADGPRLRVRPKSLLTPGLLDRMRTHKAGILDLLSLGGWPEESLECVRETGKLIARFHPFVDQPVETPEGTGRLVTIAAEYIGVVLGRRSRVSYFLPGEVRPPDSPSVTADYGVQVH